jgi:hypothetical protein
VPALVAAAVVLAAWQEAAMNRAERRASVWARMRELVRRWWPAGMVLAVLWLPCAALTLANENSAMRASRKLLRAETPGAWLGQWAGGYVTYWQAPFYVLSGDPSNGIAGQGVELPIEAPLVLLGLAAVVWGIARRSAADRLPARAEWLLLAGALLLAPLPASLMSPNPHLTRAVLAAPLFALLVGAGLQLFERITSRLAGRRRAIAPALAGALLIALAWQGMARFDDYQRNYPALVEGKYHDGLRESVERLVQLAPGYDEVWIDDAMPFPYVYVLAAGGVTPSVTQATIESDHPGTTFNTVRAVGSYRFVSLKDVPRDLPTVAATVTSLGNPGYLIQEWRDGSRRVLLLRRM